VRTLASYRMITDHPEYNQFGHFWVPGALLDYDLPDLPELVAPRPVLMLDPVDQMSRRLDAAAAQKLLRPARAVYRALGVPDGVAVERTAGSPASLARHIAERL
jgi:hypothetical protein